MLFYEASGGRAGRRAVFLCVSRVRIVRKFQTLLPWQISFYSCKYGRKLWPWQNLTDTNFIRTITSSNHCCVSDSLDKCGCFPWSLKAFLLNKFLSRKLILIKTFGKNRYDHSLSLSVSFLKPNMFIYFICLYKNVTLQSIVSFKNTELNWFWNSLFPNLIIIIGTKASQDFIASLTTIHLGQPIPCEGNLVVSSMCWRDINLHSVHNCENGLLSLMQFNHIEIEIIKNTIKFVV